MVNIKYIKTAFSADCSKKFWWENYGANYGQNLPNLCAIFCPWCFTLKVSERFQFTLPYGEWPWMIRPSRPFNFNSHSHTGVTKGNSHKIKISATQLVFVFLFYKRILPHKRAFFNVFLIKSTTKSIL